MSLRFGNRKKRDPRTQTQKSAKTLCIMRDLQRGLTMAEIARSYGVSQQWVAQVRERARSTRKR
jgi:transposase-like protein